MMSSISGPQTILFGGFRAIPYATVLAQVNNLDDDVFNKLPPQPTKRKPPSPNKQKGKTPPEDEPPTTSGATASSHPSTSVTSQASQKKLSSWRTLFQTTHQKSQMSGVI